jgi:hypothetical protein
MTYPTTPFDPGTPLHELVRMAIPICREAERLLPRRGPGRPVEFADWAFAVLVLIVVVKRRTTKGAQYRFLHEHRRPLIRWLGLPRFPARSTYFDRYRRAARLLAPALKVHADWLSKRRRVDARCVAADKTLVTARGPAWSNGLRAKGERPKGVDAEAAWSYSQCKGWVYGYGVEVVVSAGATGPVWPLLGSVDPAPRREARTFPEKIARLPEATRYVLADIGYDSDALGEAIEWDAEGRRTGRRFVCPQQVRHNARRPAKRVWRETRRRKRKRWRRRRRRRFVESPGGRALYRRRGKTVEPFFDWLKALFDFGDRVWHRGLDNNRTMILAALLTYQLLLRYNRLKGQINGQIRWILDAL